LEEIMRLLAAVGIAGVLAFGGAGCTPRETTGTAIGTGVGTAAGALATDSLGGALAGGAIGAGAGYLITRNTYRCWKTNVFGHRYRGWCAK
jgi:hypothetical protein